MDAASTQTQSVVPPTFARIVSDPSVVDEAVAECVERTLDLELDADELWELVSTADGWSRWLADTADFDVQPGAVGEVTDGQAVKRVRVDAVVPGRRVGFTWWSEDSPNDAGIVELRIEDISTSARRLHIIERRLMPSTTDGSAVDVSLQATTNVSLSDVSILNCSAALDRRLAWETRLWLLGSCMLVSSTLSVR